MAIETGRMSPALAEVYVPLWQDAVGVHAKWSTYEGLLTASTRRQARRGRG